ncbi:peroxiredoxin family protein [Flavobacterium sp. LAR06]|uniref:peroxiredoxin family protein n=1 Tax=Flavobacterium sp. LAR06 TaxID=3064897 RepID=UPI0035C04AD4
MKKRKIILLILAFCFFTVISITSYETIIEARRKKEFAENRRKIPVFLYENINGESFSNQNLKKDTPTVFVYFHSECEYCNEEAHNIKENIKKFSNVQLVFISFENVEKIKIFAVRYQLDTYNNVHFISDPSTNFASIFDVQGLPCLVLYDKDQNLIEKIEEEVEVKILLKKLE